MNFLLNPPFDIYNFVGCLILFYDYYYYYYYIGKEI